MVAEKVDSLPEGGVLRPVTCPRCGKVYAKTAIRKIKCPECGHYFTPGRSPS